MKAFHSKKSPHKSLFKQILKKRYPNMHAAKSSHKSLFKQILKKRYPNIHAAKSPHKSLFKQILKKNYPNIHMGYTMPLNLIQFSEVIFKYVTENAVIYAEVRKVLKLFRYIKSKSNKTTTRINIDEMNIYQCSGSSENSTSNNATESGVSEVSPTCDLDEELLTMADKIVFATALKADILEFLNDEEITESKKRIYASSIVDCFNYIFKRHLGPFKYLLCEN